VFWFSLQISLEIFLILRRLLRDIINVQYSVRYIVVRFLWHLNFRDRFFRNPQTPNSMKTRPLGAELFHANWERDRRTDGRRDRTKFIAASRDFENASKISELWKSLRGLGCYTVLKTRKLPTFRRSIVLAFWVSNTDLGAITIPSKVENCLLVLNLYQDFSDNLTSQEWSCYIKLPIAYNWMLDGNYYIEFDNSVFLLFRRYCSSHLNTRRSIFKAVDCYTRVMFTRTQFCVP